MTVVGEVQAGAGPTFRQGHLTAAGLLRTERQLLWRPGAASVRPLADWRWRPKPEINLVPGNQRKSEVSEKSTRAELVGGMTGFQTFTSDNMGLGTRQRGKTVVVVFLHINKASGITLCKIHTHCID